MWKDLKIKVSFNVKKNTKFIDNKITNTSLHILSFNLYKLPAEIKIGFLVCKIDPYIPNPIQCKKCFKLGHTRKNCSGNDNCEICASALHDPSPCNKIQCINCNHEHRSTNKNCPTYKQRQEILKIKTLTNCSYKEASQQAQNIQTYEIPTEDLQTAIEERNKKIKNSTNNTANPTINTTTSDNKQDLKSTSKTLQEQTKKSSLITTDNLLSSKTKTSITTIQHQTYQTQ